MACTNCGCEQEVILIPGVGGVPGPQGPPGPTGPPGPGASFPIAASNISVINAGFANLQEVINFLLYVPVTINSFSTPVSIYEIGSSVSSLTFNWNLNKDPLTQGITGPDLTPPVLVPSQRSVVGTISPALAPVSVGVNYNYTLAVSDGTSSPTSVVNVSFLNNIYVGDSVIPGAINSAFVNSLTKNLQADRVKTFVSNSTGSQYAWVAIRQILGSPTFIVNGFSGGFEAPVATSVTNSSGFSETYSVYRSTNPAIGPVTINVS